MTYLPDQRIRYTCDNLGTIAGGANDLVNAGTEGRYLGPSPDEGWHFTEPDEFPTAVCPVTLEMIEPVEEAA